MIHCGLKKRKLLNVNFQRNKTNALRIVVHDEPF
jgi:hypothetical protein